MNQELIGRFIQKLRKEKNMTQEELAEKLGVTNNAISNWENGRRLPDYTIVGFLCKELGITVNDLFNGSIINEKEINKKTDENIINMLKHENREKKKYKRNIILSIIITIMIVTVSIFLLYFVNNYNKIKVYSIYGENDYFTYNATFFKSNIKYFFFSENLSLSDNAVNKKIKIKSAYVMGSDIHIISSNALLHNRLEENYGYSETFSDEVVDNLDNWTLVINFEEYGKEKETTIKLQNELIMDNSSLIPTKHDTIYETQPTKKETEEYEKNQEIEYQNNLKYAEYLESIGFKKTEESIVLGDEKTIPLYEKKISNDQTFIVRIEGITSNIDYYSSDYNASSLAFYNLVHFYNNVGMDEKERWDYEYNIDTNLGSCKVGKCPDNFIRKARKYYELYQNEFKGFFDIINKK